MRRGGLGASLIWRKYRKDFKTKNSHLRGYGLSYFGETRRNLFINLAKLLSFPFKVIKHFISLFYKYLFKALSWIILGQDSNASLKYGFHFDGDLTNIFTKDKIYNKKTLNEFLARYSKYGIGVSFNTFKSFNYLKRLKANIKLKQNIKVFEIGAGVFNFGHLLSFELKSFEYFVCDLPEMIVQAHKEITEIYKPKCGGDYEIFLPNQQEKFNDSNSTRKVLFITPEQLHDGVLGKHRRFDLFINHESFAEMDINTVNKYLFHVSNLMKAGSIVNIINRHSRIQSISYESTAKMKLENITCFKDYQLSFCKVVIKDIDRFRAVVPSLQSEPNIFFIGKTK